MFVAVNTSNNCLMPGALPTVLIAFANSPIPPTTSAIPLARLVISSDKLSILWSLLNAVKASTKPLPIISCASAAATLNRLILPAYVSNLAAA